MQAADRDGSGGLTVQETRLFFQYQLFYDDCWEVFRQVDADEDSTINREEFAALMLEGFGLVYDRPAFEAAFDEIDLNGSGSIDLREFCAWLGNEHYGSVDELTDVVRWCCLPLPLRPLLLLLLLLLFIIIFFYYYFFFFFVPNTAEHTGPSVHHHLFLLLLLLLLLLLRPQHC